MFQTSVPCRGAVPPSLSQHGLLRHHAQRVRARPDVPLRHQVCTVYSTVEYSTVQYSTCTTRCTPPTPGLYSTVQYSTVQYSRVQYSTVRARPDVPQDTRSVHTTHADMQTWQRCLAMFRSCCCQTSLTSLYWIYLV